MGSTPSRVHGVSCGRNGTSAAQNRQLGSLERNVATHADVLWARHAIFLRGTLFFVVC